MSMKTFFLIVVILIAGILSYVLYTKGRFLSTTTLSPVETIAPTPTIALIDYFSYQGKAGKSALQLLKDNASAQQDSTGLVVAINGRKADPSKNEYWAFYVNVKLAEVGPAEYQTKEGDKIEWKIDHY